MRPRFLLFITLLAICRPRLDAQVLTNSIPPPQSGIAGDTQSSSAANSSSLPNTDLAPANLPDDPGQELVPIATPEPAPVTGTPVEWEAKEQTWSNDTLTLTGDVVGHYRDYVIRADAVTYNRKTTELHAEGHMQISGGPNDVLINATNGDMTLNMRTARFYNPTRCSSPAAFCFKPAKAAIASLTAPLPIAVCPIPTGALSPTPSISMMRRRPHPTRFSSFSACLFFICLICTILPTQPRASAAC
jgi:hypothetical protein